MSIAQRVAAAARDGRLWSGARRRLLFPTLFVREAYQRLALGLRSSGSSAELPAIVHSGSPSTSTESTMMRRCFDSALGSPSQLPPEIRKIEGMSGQRYRSFINHLVGSVADARYLEVGSWAGSTAAAALTGNRAAALCIDNWSLFGGPRDRFFENIKLAVSDQIDFRFLEQDFRKVDFASIGQFNIYLFDGPHEEIDQYDGVVMAQPALTNKYFLIVDDWNWRAVRLGTFQALLDTRCRVESAIEVRTSLDNHHTLSGGTNSEWHNGYFLAVVVKPS